MKTILCTIALIPSLLIAAAVQRKTVWNGVYTEAQAVAGENVYRSSCRGCHGDTLEGGSGFALRGPQFMDGWREDNVGSLYSFIRTTMPPRGELSDEAAVNVVAYILWENEFPMGDTELNTSDMRSIQIEHKDGPRPLPNFALVEIVGCLTPIDGENWSLTRASDPVRTRKVIKLTPSELKDAESRPLGNQTFPLLGWRMLGAFNRDAHVGHKMHAKGVLMQQQGTLRLSLTTLDSLSPSCPAN